MVSIFTFFPEFQTDKVEPEAAPRVAVGAASPLWLMFGGAAAAGAAYWWWASRWREAVNLEALMALTPEPVAPPVEAQAVLDERPEPMIEAALEPAVEAIALAADAAETVMDAVEESVEVVAETVVAANEEVAEAALELTAGTDPAPVAAEAAEATVGTIEPAVQTTTKEAADDLTQLVGIGPKLAASLAELGVTRFSQIAAWTPDELASFDQLLNLKGRAERDAWIAQAQRLAQA